MLALIEINGWHWAGFILVILVLLGLDLGIFHRKAHVVRFGEALAWTAVWFTLAMVFAMALRPSRGVEASWEFLTGYLIELSLSMDNVFVIALIFAYFRVPNAYQHRVLFWGILGALVMRGLMIWLGAELVRQYQWMLYIFGVFLVFTGIRLLIREEDEVDPRRNPVLQLVRRYFPVTPDFDGPKFFTLQNGREVLTPLALVLVMVETTDLVFALDSIPAIFAVTTDPFIVFTSNVCAILGLRSLYFVLAGAIAYFRYLKYGLATVLAFIGFKMLIVDWFKVPTTWSLGVVAVVILGAIAVSAAATRDEETTGPKAGDTGDADDHVPMPGAPPASQQPLSRNLEQILQTAAPARALTLNTVFLWTEGRGVFLFMVLLCAPFLVGVSPPGLSTPLGAVIGLFGIRLAFGQAHGLPRWIGGRSLPSGFHRLLGGSVNVLRFLEKWLVRPRRTGWLVWRSARCLNGLILAFMALLLALPLPFPLTNTLPAYAILILALSVMEGDGVLIWIGYVLSAGTVLYFAAWADAILLLFTTGYTQAVHWMQHLL